MADFSIQIGKKSSNLIHSTRDSYDLFPHPPKISTIVPHFWPCWNAQICAGALDLEQIRLTVRRYMRILPKMLGYSIRPHNLWGLLT